MERKALVRRRIKDVCEMVDQGFLELAELLAEAYHKEYFIEWGYGRFEEFCLEEVNVGYRKAMYLIEIWGTTQKLQLPRKAVTSVGWSKMKELVTSSNLECSNQRFGKTAEAMLDWAAKLSLRELTTEMSKKSPRRLETIRVGEYQRRKDVSLEERVFHVVHGLAEFRELSMEEMGSVATSTALEIEEARKQLAARAYEDGGASDWGLV